MRFHCTLYKHEYAFDGNGGYTGTEPTYDTTVGRVRVSAATLRQAAARAYVILVGRARAERMRAEAHAPEHVIAQETSTRAIAASLRKTMRRIGEGYELDQFLHAWFIRVQAVTAPPRNPRSHAQPMPFFRH
ncbi:MAG: hypothetical protein U0736_25895, partial [Gemmataceae bacterium]